ncbi:hypothetical protein BU16DRAFT_543949 [Lophium mytilinum]|uniref:Uncharacterized protein n=1 Tax=Lophium mytilinum TaxID=390894 RepID=A0A6A6QGP2_9PEZI|nr:hypothetical protein BU16DRAFT_543949 [Lophium mytilinum]
MSSSSFSSSIPLDFPHDIAKSQNMNVPPPRQRKAKMLGRELLTSHPYHTQEVVSIMSEVMEARIAAAQRAENQQSSADIFTPAARQGIGFLVDKFVREEVLKQSSLVEECVKKEVSKHVSEYLSILGASATVTTESTPQPSSGTSSPKPPSSATAPPSYDHSPEEGERIRVLDPDTPQSGLPQGTQYNQHELTLVSLIDDGIGNENPRSSVVNTTDTIHVVNEVCPGTKDKPETKTIVIAPPSPDKERSYESQTPIRDGHQSVSKNEEEPVPPMCPRCPALEAKCGKLKKKADKNLKLANANIQNVNDLQDLVDELEDQIKDCCYNQDDDTELSVGELTLSEKKEGVVKVVTRYRQQLVEGRVEMRELRQQVNEQNEQLAELNQEKAKQQEQIVELWEQLRQRDHAGKEDPVVIWNVAPRPAPGDDFTYHNTPTLAKRLRDGERQESEHELTESAVSSITDSIIVTQEEAAAAKAEPGEDAKPKQDAVAGADPEEDTTNEVRDAIQDTMKVSDLPVPITSPDAIQHNITQQEHQDRLPYGAESQSQYSEVVADIIAPGSIPNTLTTDHATHHAAIQMPAPALAFPSGNLHQQQFALANLNADAVPDVEPPTAFGNVRTAITHNYRSQAAFNPFGAPRAAAIGFGAGRPVANDLLADTLPDGDCSGDFGATHRPAQYNTFSFDSLGPATGTMRPVSISGGHPGSLDNGVTGTSRPAPTVGGQGATPGCGRVNGLGFSGLPISSLFAQAPMAPPTAPGMASPPGPLPPKSRFF